MKISIKLESWKIEGGFCISYLNRTHTDVIVVEIFDDIGEFIGRGETVPYKRYNETIDSVSKQILLVKKQIIDELKSGGDALDLLQKSLPSGAARNALDLALWDLKAKKINQDISSLLKLDKPKEFLTAYTIAIDTAEIMGKKALDNSDRALLKIKLSGDILLDLKRLEMIRKNAPNSKLIIDANEGFKSKVEYNKIINELVNLDIKLIEQPFPEDIDELLLDVDKPIPICADESCHNSADLDKLVGKYDFINIKLNKTGGLTEAVTLLKNAKEMKFGIMIGCMVSTSLAIAPATYLTPYADFIDLDGPILLEQDRENGLNYNRSMVGLPSKELWG